MINSGQMNVKDNRGTALAELALVLPLLLLLIMGTLDFGKAFNEWIDETHLANEGARLAAVGYLADGCTSAANPNTCIAQQIQGEASIPELKNGRALTPYAAAQGAARVCISYPTNPATTTHGLVGDPVQVTVATTYHWLNYLVRTVPFPRRPSWARRRCDSSAGPRTAAGATTCYPAT